MIPFEQAEFVLFVQTKTSCSVIAVNDSVGGSGIVIQEVVMSSMQITSSFEAWMRTDKIRRQQMTTQKKRINTPTVKADSEN